MKLFNKNKKSPEPTGQLITYKPSAMTKIEKKPEDLTPWEMFQLSRYGNILPAPPLEDEEFEHELSTEEYNYFFNLENGQQ